MSRGTLLGGVLMVYNNRRSRVHHIGVGSDVACWKVRYFEAPEDVDAYE